jgi:hypothetical protein
MGKNNIASNLVTATALFITILFHQKTDFCPLNKSERIQCIMTQDHQTVFVTIRIPLKQVECFLICGLF